MEDGMKQPRHRLSDSSEASTVSTFSTDSETTSADADNASTTSTSKCSGSQNIRVVTRIRPLSTKELNEKSKESVTAQEALKMIKVGTNKDFAFDAVFGPNTTQKHVYESTAGDMIRNNLFKGFNVTVLAYGQTGSGKTHTIFGGNGNMISNDLNEELDGIIPRAVHEVFGHMNNITCGSERMKVKMSYLEIYNEEAKDLLSEEENPPDLQIRDAGGDVIVQNLTLHDVSSPMEVASLMESASEKRSTAATLMNAVSSRSHAICTMYITIQPLPNQTEDEEEITAKLTLVDLAGSERAKKTGAEGTRLKEGININKGLFVLGQVVSSLAELGQQNGSSDSSTSSIHVKYRDSKLTRLLQDSLGGNSKTVMVACVSPADYNIDETVNTLRYAERTRSIKNAAVRNVVAAPLSPAEAAALRRENQMLKLKLFQAEAKISSMSSLPVSSTLTTISTCGKSTSVTATAKSEKQDIVDNDLNGLSIKDLNIVTKLKTHCSSLEEKLHLMEEKCKATADDTLDASIRSDKWQVRCESLMNILSKNNIEVPSMKDIESGNDISIVQTLRAEIIDLKDRLKDATIDAEVSRSIAAAVVKGNGEIDTAETMALVSSSEDNNNSEYASSLSENEIEAMSAELIAMSGSIEDKEAMISQIKKERELMESMRSHFESAIESLQNEVGSLSSERDTLMTRLERENPASDDIQTKRLRERTKTLEARIKELKQKAAEHGKSLRLHSQAEKKCQKLEAELLQDKKRRADLQRKLKKESEERRNEQKQARLDAARMLKDSQKLKLELNKVKEAAAKQENVLRRKAAEAMHKQKMLAERAKKRARNSGNEALGDLSSDRREEVTSFLERELSNAISLQKLREEIEENTQLLEECEEKKEVVRSQKTVGDDSTNLLRSLDSEIDLRNKIIEQLEKNVKEIFKSVQRNPTNKHSTKFLEQSFWKNLSKSEVRYLSQLIFSKFVEQQFEFDTLNTTRASRNATEVSKAVEKERRSKEKEIFELKVQHSQDISSLLESTKSTVQQQMKKNIAPSKNCDMSTLDESIKENIDNMLNAYFTSYNSLGEKVKADLDNIKESQEGMKRLVDGMADEIISQNEAKAMLASQKKKKNAKKQEVHYEPEEFFESEDEMENEVEDGEDSDWSPETPMPVRKKVRKSMEDEESKKSPEPSAKNVDGTSSQSSSPREDYNNMTVVQLKELLRENGLTVSGKKSELIKRLQFYGNSKARDVITASARKRARANPRIEIPDTTSKKLRLLSPIPAEHNSPVIEVKSEPIVAPPSSTKKTSVITSSTKASSLRRRTPTESETAILVTKRTTRKSPRATSASSSARSLGNTSQSSVSMKSARSTTSFKSEAKTERSRSNTRRPISSSSSKSSKSVKSFDSKLSSLTKSTSSSISKKRTKVVARKKSASPILKRRPVALKNMTNSAQKRKTDRRKDMAKSVNAALAELEKIQDAL